MTTLTKEQIQSLRNQGQGTPQWSDETPTVITADKFVGDLEGNAETATQFKEPSRLTFTGDVSGQVNVYGSDASNVSIHVRQAENADHAEEADRAKSTTRARYADLANLATLAERATLATKAITSETATHAESADSATTAERANLSTRALNADQATHATEADHATTATNANRATNATNASHASEADHATSADTATSSARAGLAEIANVAKALDFTIIKVVTSYPETLTADALYVLVDNNGKIIGMDTKDKGPVDFDLMTIDVLSAISESTELKDGKLYAVPTEDGSGTKLDPRVANVIFKRTVNGIDVYFQVGGSGGAIVLPEASTTQKGIVQLSNTISNDETKAVTPKCISDLKDDTFITMSTAQYVYATKDNLDSVTHSLSSAIYQESQRVDNNFVTLSSAQSTYATKTELNNRTLSISQYVDETFVTLTSAQYVSGLKTFSTLPQSALTPTEDKELTTKKFIDDLFNNLKDETARASVTFGGVDKMTFTEE